MRAHFAYLGEFLHHAVFRIESCVGVVGIIAVIISILVVKIPDAIVLPAVIIVLAEAGYGAYREERQMRAEREANVRLTAKLGSLSANIPDPGPDRVSLSVHVFWEVWVNQDVSTDKLALNLIYVYEKPWWRFWKRVRFPQKGIPPKGRETTQYRKRIYAGEFQPFKDDAVFEYVGDRMGIEPHWLLELVLLTGVPMGEHRVPVFIDRDELRSRGTNPPL